MLAAASLRTNEPGVDAALLVELLGDPLAVPLHPRPLSQTAVAELVRGRLGDQADRGLRRGVPRGDGRQPAAAERAAEGARDRGRRSRWRATSRRCASSARAPRRAPCSCGSRGCTRTRSRWRARSPCSATAPTSPPSRRSPESTCAAAATATGQLARAEIMRPERAARLRPSARRRRGLPRHPARRARAAARARRAAARRGGRAGRAGRGAPARDSRARRGVGRRRRCGRAAGQAMHTGAPESAVAYLTRALAEPPPPEHEGHLLLELGIAEALTFGPAATKHLSLAYERLDDPLAAGDRRAAPRARAALHRQAGRERRRRARPRPRTCPRSWPTCGARSRRPSSRRCSSAPASSRRLRIEPPADDVEGLGAKMLAAVAAIERAYCGRAGGRVRRASRCGRSRAAS